MQPDTFSAIANQVLDTVEHLKHIDLGPRMTLNKIKCIPSYFKNFYSESLISAVSESYGLVNSCTQIVQSPAIESH